MYIKFLLLLDQSKTYSGRLSLRKAFVVLARKRKRKKVKGKGLKRRMRKSKLRYDGHAIMFICQTSIVAMP